MGALGTITLTTDEKGAALPSSVTLLAAGPWSRTPGIDVFVRGSGAWTKTTLGDAQGNVRSFTQHVDSVTGVSLAFAGSDPQGIFSGTFDVARGTIAWSGAAEAFAHAVGHDDTPLDDWRVMAFAEANGHLFATLGPAIYERKDGRAPSWKKVYVADFPANVDIKANGGLRGMAAIPNPHGTGEVLLVAAGGPTARVLGIDPSAGFSETVDVDMDAPPLQRMARAGPRRPARLQ